MAKRETTAVETEILIGTLVNSRTGEMLPDGLRLKFANGEALELRVATLSPDIISLALVHGLKQKLVDAAAISRNPDTGASATVEDKYRAVKEVYERLLAGEWNKRREAGEGGEGGLLLRALVQFYDGRKSADEVREWLNGKSKSEQVALRTNPRIAAIIEKIRPKAKPAAADTDAMLSEFEG